jgi:hypothetical protein
VRFRWAANFFVRPRLGHQTKTHMSTSKNRYAMRTCIQGWKKYFILCKFCPAVMLQVVQLVEPYTTCCGNKTLQRCHMTFRVHGAATCPCKIIPGVFGHNLFIYLFIYLTSPGKNYTNDMHTIQIQNYTSDEWRGHHNS